MDVRAGPQRRLSAKESMLWNCGAGKDSWVPWTARTSNQSILKEISPKYSLEGAEVQAPILWPPDTKNWLIGKDPDAGKDWRQQEKGTTENEMVEWHHWLHGHEFEQVLGDGDGQESLMCCSPWGHKELDTTEGLNWLTFYYKEELYTHTHTHCRV